MALPTRCLTILDVGHGNSAVVSTPEGVVVIDAGPGNVLQEYLVQQGINEVAAVLLSHADEDHIGGLLGLLGDGRFTIKKIRVNSDALKGSKIWDDLLSELEKLGLAGKGDFLPVLTSAQSGEFDLGKIKIQILGPGTYLAGKGPGATITKDHVGGTSDRKMTSNSISAVIRISNDAAPCALLTGDVDDIGLDNMTSLHIDFKAPILIFPHHGGKSRNVDPVEFTKALCNFVDPRFVIFSIGRNKHKNPRPDVVAAVRAHHAEVQVGCTQLSKHCADSLPKVATSHLTKAFARGRDEGACCLGTTLVDLDALEKVRPTREKHLKFVVDVVPQALCRK